MYLIRCSSAITYLAADHLGHGRLIVAILTHYLRVVFYPGAPYSGYILLLILPFDLLNLA